MSWHELIISGAGIRFTSKRDFEYGFLRPSSFAPPACGGGSDTTVSNPNAPTSAAMLSGTASTGAAAQFGALGGITTDGTSLLMTDGPSLRKIQ